MVVAQPVSAPLTRAAIFLVVMINPGPENRAGVRSFCADVGGLIRAVEFRDLEAGLSCVIGIGSDAWDRLFGKPRPAELSGGPRRTASRGFDTGGLDVSYPREAEGSLLRDGGADHGTPRRRSHRDRRGPWLSLLRRPRPVGVRRWHRESARRGVDRRSAHRRGGSGIRRRQLCDRAEISARSAWMERAVYGGTGAHHRPHQAGRYRTGRLGKADVGAQRA